MVNFEGKFPKCPSLSFTFLFFSFRGNDVGNILCSFAAMLLHYYNHFREKRTDCNYSGQSFKYKTISPLTQQTFACLINLGYIKFKKYKSSIKCIKIKIKAYDKIILNNIMSLQFFYYLFIVK